MKITISGPPGSGKTTVGKILAKKLKIKFYSSGDFFRKLASLKKMKINEFSRYCENNPHVDTLIDKKQIEFGKKNKNFVLDSRLGFFFIPDSIKIYLDANRKIRSQRIKKAKRKDEKNKKIKDVFKSTLEREKSERRRWIKLYDVDYKNKKNYDFVINTTHLSVNEIVERIINYLQKKKYKNHERKKLINFK